MSQLLALAGYALNLTMTTWFVLGFILQVVKMYGRDRSPFWVRVWVILKYPAGAGSFGIILADTVQHIAPSGVDYGLSVWCFFCWWYGRNDHNDDDFTKKLKKLVKKKVQQIGDKLVVVPETA